MYLGLEKDTRSSVPWNQDNAGAIVTQKLIRRSIGSVRQIYFGRSQRFGQRWNGQWLDSNEVRLGDKHITF
jgi:hypothetical protein